MIERITQAVSVVSMAILLSIIFMACNADASPGVMIHGYVFDGDHQIVANATITMYRDGVLLPISSNPALTDTNGYYAFWGMERGQYCLVASKDIHSISGTMWVQEWDVWYNFTLLAHTDELYATPLPSASPVPAVTPAATEVPAASTTPVPVASPGFELLLLLPGTGAAATLIMLERKRHA
jgi:hypothetical protein